MSFREVEQTHRMADHFQEPAQPSATTMRVPDPTDEDADHLAGSEVLDIIRPTSKAEAKVRTLRILKAHGRDETTAGPALLTAIRTHFGTWERACRHAGMDARSYRA